MRKRANTFFWRAGGVLCVVVFLNSATCGRRELWNLWSWKFATLEELSISCDTIAIVRGSALQALKRGAKWEKKIDG